MSVKYIYHHLGLGDHIICNSIIRIYSYKYDNIVLFVKEHNLCSVKNMFIDLNNITYITGDDYYINRYCGEHEIDLLKIGFEYTDHRLNFDESFYNQLNINFNERWDLFYIKRNIDSEIKLFNKFNLKPNTYIFVHDDSDRGFNINIENNNMKIIRPIKGLTENIFDYLYLIENSAEIHCIDSSFRVLIDSINLKNDKIYFYTKSRPEIQLAKSKLNWIIK